jgi:wyosine [tRNA(Phe)-imidazoG37] synthetase (radical SAM superfamily)
MPTFDQIKNFGQKLAEQLGYEQVKEKADSLVVLLSPQQKKQKCKLKKGKIISVLVFSV